MWAPELCCHNSSFETLIDLTKNSDSAHHQPAGPVYGGMTVTINMENVEENPCACWKVIQEPLWHSGTVLPSIKLQMDQLKALKWSVSALHLRLVLSIVYCGPPERWKSVFCTSLSSSNTTTQQGSAELCLLGQPHAARSLPTPGQCKAETYARPFENKRTL